MKFTTAQCAHMVKMFCYWMKTRESNILRTRMGGGGGGGGGVLVQNH